MAFTGVTVDTVVAGVQALFPKFTFDANSRPSLDNVKKYAATAINSVSRQVRFKGYEPADIISEEDLLFVSDWIELRVAADVSSTLDALKDTKAVNVRWERLRAIESGFEQAVDPFPSVIRGTGSQVYDAYPSHFVRVKPSALST